MAKLVIGLDMSLTGTGICMIDQARKKKGKKEVGFTTIKSQKHADVNVCSRMLQIMEDTFFHFPEKVDLVAIESTFLMAKRPASAVISVLGMLMREELVRRKIKYVDVAPSQLKKFITGSGKAEKEKIMMCVLESWGLKTADNNQADAIVLAKIAMAMKDSKMQLTGAQADVIGKLKGKR